MPIKLLCYFTAHEHWDWDLNLDNFNWNVDLDFRNWDWDIKLMDKLMEDMPLLDITDF